MTGGEPRHSARKLRLRDVAEILNEKGVEPIAAICDVLPELRADMRVKTLLSLAEFIHPKLGRTEHVGKDGDDIKVVSRIEIVPLSDNGKS